MIINVIATGSSGNLYEILDKSGNSILIEAGVPVATYMKHKEGTKFPEMCIITHAHGDHAGHRKEYSAMMQTYLNEHKCESKNFKALGFSVYHGGCITYAYIIKVYTENKFFFFGTDMQYSEEYVDLFESLRFWEVETFLIECNYNDYLLHLSNKDERIGCERHMSDNDVVRFMRKVKPKNPAIITIHGSNRLSANNYTKKYIQSKILNSTVDVATGATWSGKNLFLIT